jgi:hypothetical protein
MLDYPNALNVRKLAFVLGSGPLALLLLFGILDVSMSSASKASKTKAVQLSEQPCSLSYATMNVAKIYGQECQTKLQDKVEMVDSKK